MRIFDKCVRPYCENCKLIWGSRSIGFIMICGKCGQRLILKSFNPWNQCLKGLGVISLGGLTLMSGLPIVWIGGFLWGGQLIFNGFKQRNSIKILDSDTSDTKEHQWVDSTNVIITCGYCQQKIRLPKGKGITETKCSYCFREYKIRT